MDARARAVGRVGVAAMLVAMLGGGCAQTVPTKTELARERVELPLDEHWGGWYLRVGEGARAYWIWMDTGCRDVVLSPSLATELGVARRVVLPTVVTDAAGNQLWSSTTARVKELRIGGAVFSEFDADEAALTRTRGPTKLPVRALVGMNLFRDCLLTMDFARRKLVLERGELPEPNGRDILEYRFTMAGNWELPAVLCGRKVWAKIDTGYGGELTASSDLVEGLPIAGEWKEVKRVTAFGEETCRAGRLEGEFVMGVVRATRPRILIGERPGRLLVGADMLRDYRVTIDQKNRRIRFARSEGDDWGVGGG